MSNISPATSVARSPVSGKNSPPLVAVFDSVIENKSLICLVIKE